MIPAPTTVIVLISLIATINIHPVYGTGTKE